MLAEGVDEEPVEKNRRLFTGPAFAVIATLSTLYARFTWRAERRVDQRLDGMNPLLPQFPLETWNFRIVHIAGALALGFLLFAARLFTDAERPATPILSKAGLLLLIPVAVAGYTATDFALMITSGDLQQMGGLTVWVSSRYGAHRRAYLQPRDLLVRPAVARRHLRGDRARLGRKRAARALCHRRPCAGG